MRCLTDFPALREMILLCRFDAYGSGTAGRAIDGRWFVAPGSVFRVSLPHRSELFPDSFRLGLFESRPGVPSLPAY